jgi:hypothetical protein
VKKRLARLGVVALLVSVVTAIGLGTLAPAPAKAKCYYTFNGHLAVRYEQSDIPADIRPYISKLEYDAVSAPGMGARLYLTTKGAWYGTSYGNAYRIAQFVVGQPYWAGNRNATSVAYEIAFHCPLKTNPIHVEYFYADLKVNSPPIVF